MKKSITCGKCKAEGVENRGRGLCKTCNNEELWAGRLKNWRFDRKRRVGVCGLPLEAPLSPLLGSATCGPSGALPRPAAPPAAPEPSPGPKDVAVSVPFQGEDLGLYERLVREARFNRRTLAGQVLFCLECDLGTDRAVRPLEEDAGFERPVGGFAAPAATESL